MRKIITIKVINIVVLSAFLVNNVAYGLGIAPASRVPAEQREIIDTLRTRLPEPPIDLRAVRAEYEGDGRLADPATGKAYIDSYSTEFHKTRPEGWNDDPVNNEAYLTGALKALLCNKFGIPADRTNIEEDYLPETEKGELWIAQAKPVGENKYVWAVNTKVAGMWNDIWAHDVYFSVTAGHGGRRMFSVSRSLIDYFTPRLFGAKRANLDGLDRLMAYAAMLWLSSSYAISSIPGNLTSAGDKQFVETARLILRDSAALPGLSSNPDERELVMAFACAINRAYFNRSGITVPQFQAEPARAAEPYTDNWSSISFGGQQKILTDIVTVTGADIPDAILALEVAAVRAAKTPEAEKQAMDALAGRFEDLDGLTPAAAQERAEALMKRVGKTLANFGSGVNAGARLDRVWKGRKVKNGVILMLGGNRIKAKTLEELINCLNRFARKRILPQSWKFILADKYSSTVDATRDFFLTHEETAYRLDWNNPQGIADVLKEEIALARAATKAKNPLPPQGGGMEIGQLIDLAEKDPEAAVRTIIQADLPASNGIIDAIRDAFIGKPKKLAAFNEALDRLVTMQPERPQVSEIRMMQNLKTAMMAAKMSPEAAKAAFMAYRKLRPKLFTIGSALPSALLISTVFEEAINGLSEDGINPQRFFERLASKEVDLSRSDAKDMIIVVYAGASDRPEAAEAQKPIPPQGGGMEIGQLIDLARQDPKAAAQAIVQADLPRHGKLVAAVKEALSKSPKKLAEFNEELSTVYAVTALRPAAALQAAELEKLRARKKMLIKEGDVRKVLGSLIKLIPSTLQESVVKNLAVWVLFNAPGHEEILRETFSRSGIDNSALDKIFSRLKTVYSMTGHKTALRIAEPEAQPTRLPISAEQAVELLRPVFKSVDEVIGAHLVVRGTVKNTLMSLRRGRIKAEKAKELLSDILRREGLDAGIADAWILQATQPLAMAGVPERPRTYDWPPIEEEQPAIAPTSAEFGLNPDYEHPLPKEIMEFKVETGKGMETGIVKLEDDMLKNIWAAVTYFHKVHIKVAYAQEGIGNLSQKMQDALRDIRQRQGGNVIECKPFSDEKGLRDLIQPEEGVLNIVLTAGGSSGEIVKQLAAKDPNLFAKVRSMSMILPDGYNGMGAKEKTFYQARMMMEAIFARLYKKGETPMVEFILTRMLQGHIGNCTVEDFLNGLVESEGESPDSIARRIENCLNRIVSFAEETAEKLEHLKLEMREFWSAA